MLRIDSDNDSTTQKYKASTDAARVVADFGNSQWRRGGGSRRTRQKDSGNNQSHSTRSGRHIYTPLLPRSQMVHSHCNP